MNILGKKYSNREKNISDKGHGFDKEQCVVSRVKRKADNECNVLSQSSVFTVTFTYTNLE